MKGTVWTNMHGCATHHMVDDLRISPQRDLTWLHVRRGYVHHRTALHMPPRRTWIN
jgi:hypothetical protein